MNAKKFQIIMVMTFTVLLFSLSISSCSNANNNNAAFTLYKGVSLLELKDITNDVNQSITVNKEPDGYVFTVISYFNYEIAPPYLTTTNNHKATLVLEPKKSRHLFNASAETQRFLKINIKGRLGSGDTVYVLNNYEVIGHVVLP